jgi:2-oxoglutarate dehydrogenase E2 component (dihydrolipoamide succinyltransferase)
MNSFYLNLSAVCKSINKYPFPAMAKTELVLPAMGEGIIEATIIRWLVKEGDIVSEDQSLLEIATDKVDSEIPSPVNGILTKIIVPDGGVPAIGDIIAEIETDSEKNAAGTGKTRGDNEAGATRQAESDRDRKVYKEGSTVTGGEGSKSQERENIPVGETETDNTEGAGSIIKGLDYDTGEKPRAMEMPRQTPSGKFLTPLVRSIASKEKISLEELDGISGSGDEGRINKDDVMKYLEKRPGHQKPEYFHAHEGKEAAVADQNGKSGITDPEPTLPESGTPGKTSEYGDKIIEMDRVRRLIAGHMISSIQTSAHVTSFIDADVTVIVKWREANKDGFMKRENQKITFTPFFIEATAKALTDFPRINISVQGTSIIMKKNINIGMAVALPEGNLIVPVIKNADEKNLKGLVIAVNDLADRARNRKLQPDEISGGTFTITNFGAFRNTTGTPIINQPEVAILGIGAIIKKPVVIETKHGDVIAIRHMMTLSLSFDHRVVDGALGGKFLSRIAEYLESFDPGRKI